MNEYIFSEASPFVNFINANKSKIIGQRILGYYSGAGLGSMSESPAVFELEQYAVIVRYFWISDIIINIVDNGLVKSDLSLNFLYADQPESRNLRTWVSEFEFPFIGQRISDVVIERFSDAFEGYEPRPQGGDYFSVVTVLFDSGGKIHICAADAIFDGYMEVWS